MRFLISTVLIYYAKISAVYKLTALMKNLKYNLPQKVVSPLMPAIEQRYSIKFCILIGKSPTETNQLLSEAYVTLTLSRTRMFEWNKRFRDGHQEVEDEVRDGIPTTATSPEMIEAVQDTIAGDGRLSTKQVADTVGISKTSVFRILHEDLIMSKVCERWVFRLLTPEMRQRRVVSVKRSSTAGFTRG